MQHKNISLVVVLCLFVFSSIFMVQAKNNKVALCHVDDEGNLIPIKVSENAVPAHEAHGDLFIGVDVDENCKPLVVAITMTDNYGYLWELELNIGTGDLVGTVDRNSSESFLWNVAGIVVPGDLLDTSLSSSVTLEATNPEADGCLSGYTDSFIYTGDRNVGTNTFSGTWLNICSGSPSGSGDWTGTFNEVLFSSLSIQSFSSVSGNAPGAVGK